MNTKNIIILLCFILYYIATVYSNSDEAVSMEIDATEVELLAKQMDKLKIRSTTIDKLRNSLKPAGVRDLLRLQSMPRPFCLNAVKKFLIDRRWPADIVEELFRAHNEGTWPPGISNAGFRLDNINYVKSYKCRYIPVTNIPCQAVIVFTDDNITMPDKMIADIGFLMIFNSSGIYVIQ
ncbi:uncharacterized protein LOC126834060 [Adelges cooleyi]|uniref:uncharacterized protein LOC126834060 n=1 Tax=Adelges cooleyi TaxID=133065 RepID=UPI00217F9683|nr:uncharacterized protein LOC126834060 [Adelges cooleyi]